MEDKVKGSNTQSEKRRNYFLGERRELTGTVKIRQKTCSLSR